MLATSPKIWLPWYSPIIMTEPLQYLSPKTLTQKTLQVPKEEKSLLILQFDIAYINCI